jgi:hypothetical protein
MLNRRAISVARKLEAPVEKVASSPGGENAPELGLSRLSNRTSARADPQNAIRPIAAHFETAPPPQV